MKDDYRNRKKVKSGPDKAEEGASAEVTEEEDNKMTKEYKENLVKYGMLKKKLPLKGSEREKFTMQMLSKFKNKLKEVKETVTEVEGEEFNADDNERW